MSTIFCVVLLFLSYSYSDAACNDKKDCVSCTNTKSWSGASCRWCPRDSECHAHGSLLNKCSITENIKSAGDCENIVYAEYDNNLAYKMVFLSALAYSDDVAKYIHGASDVQSFQLIKQVTKQCSGGADCSGFVAVSHSEKAIAIAFRGSEHFKQVTVQALRVLVEPKTSFQAGGKVQKYFLEAFRLVWNDLESYIYEQIKTYPNYKVWVTGHSLGGALASLASTQILYESKTTKNNLMMYTFGQPRVGNYDYAKAHDKLVIIGFRVTHYRDIVVHLPTCHGAPVACIAPGGGPYHHGKEIYYGNEVMTKDSSYKTCEGLPHNEDLGCSDNQLVWSKCLPLQLAACINDHRDYFGISVGQWWKSIEAKLQTKSVVSQPKQLPTSSGITLNIQPFAYLFILVCYFCV